MSIHSIIAELTETDSPDAELVRKVSKSAASDIASGSSKIIDLVQTLNSVLTNTDHSKRLLGFEVLSNVIKNIDKDAFNEKEIKTLGEFVCLRLADHKSMEQPALECLKYFVDCPKKPDGFSNEVIDFLKSRTNVRKMETTSRFLVYELVKKLTVERYQRNRSIDNSFVYAVIELMEGENNPTNLIVCFHTIHFILTKFEDLDPYVDDIFEWLSSYYPIDYTPAEDQRSRSTVTRSDLVDSLYDCFFANELNSANLQTLLLEKLESNLLSTKVESLHCLVRCYETFSLNSIKDYASTLWTAIRMDCLKKEGLVDSQLLEASYRALGAICKKLSEDDEKYFMFISDMYEELAIAFRKPEMDLFKPSAALLAHAVKPQLKSFIYVLDKVLPVSINAISSNELRPITGLVYLFEQLELSHPGSELNASLNESIMKILRLISGNFPSDENCLKFLKICIRYKIKFNRQFLDELVNELKSNINSPLDIEGCLALICANFGRLDLIADITPGPEIELSHLITLIDQFKPMDQDAQIRFSIYLRLLVIILNSSDKDTIGALNQEDLSKLLTSLRDITRTIVIEQRSIENIARIHAIIYNKLDGPRLNDVLMPFFQSDFCKKLTDPSESQLTRRVYLVMIRWILKSIVLRNHQFSIPLINLLLNFVSSDMVTEDLSLMGAEALNFVYSLDKICSFDRKNHYQIFSLHRQKFYTQTSEEIVTRCNLVTGNKRHYLICCLAKQVPHLSSAVYKKKYGWLIRELIKSLSMVKSQIQDRADEKAKSELIVSLFDCMESLIGENFDESTSGLLSSIVDLNLIYAKNASMMTIRRRALICLANLTVTFKNSDLLVLRPKVIDDLRPCLADEKRLVRQAAAKARLRWVLVGQPINS